MAPLSLQSYWTRTRHFSQTTPRRLRLELLEDRVYPGDAVLGVWALALWGTSQAAVDGTSRYYGPKSDEEGRSGLVSSVDPESSVSAIALVPSFADQRNGYGSTGQRAGIASTIGTTGEADTPLFGDDTLARQVAVHRLGVAPWPGSQALPAALVGTVAGTGTARSDIRESYFASAFVGNGQSLAAASASVFSASGVQLSFDASTGQLAIRANAASHTIREALTADGFVDVTLDGRSHSSNPQSGSFDSTLAGANGATLAGIRFEGGGQDTLILGSQHLAGTFTIQAAGAAVVTENVVAAGPMAIQAPNITVSGALQASTVGLAASGSVTVAATGRVNAVGAAVGGHVDVAAGVFVNSGQLQADGATGGQIDIQANSILNAGPITADATDTSGNGGQVHIAFLEAYIDTTAAVTSTSSTAGPGGRLTVAGGSTGRLFSSGRQLATGSVGGDVDLFGREVVLAGATVDASGQAGGGSVRIGGDFQGRNSTVVNAQTVTVTPATTIQANALRSGSGGHVFVGADQTTAFAGVVSARGGPAGGSGGLIEVSGQGNVSYAGSADAGALLGKSGTLLLDPKNLTISDAPVSIFPQFDLIDPHPTVSGGFGTDVSVLNNGNVVVINPNDDFGGANAGAVYLFDGLTGALISSLVGSHPEDRVGLLDQYGDSGMFVLSNSNYLVLSPNWNSQTGAVTWSSGSSGVSGAVSEANSLVGSNPGDQVGKALYSPSIFHLSNGNYLVESPYWNGQRGAVTWGNGSTGTSGTVSEANSLVGSDPGDTVGYVFPLSNGNYVVGSPSWNNNRGAVTWGDGSTGITGTISGASSLIGNNPGDQVGLGPPRYSGAFGVAPLSNGNYVVLSPSWNGQGGAVTWGNGRTGISGTVSDGNSLVGSNPNDQVGSNYATLLSNGNYVIDSPNWSGSRGAVTWGSGSTGVSGTVAESNSLVGTTPSDLAYNNLTALSNGNYVVDSPSWNDNRGAVTWGNGITGVSGTVSDGNSLVGSNPGDGFDTANPGDLVGSDGVTPLLNGNYVVGSLYWNGTRGAATWGNGITGVSGIVSDANSLVGSYGGNPQLRGDRVGLAGAIVPLSNGNYVVDSPCWSSWTGAVTWGNGSTGTSGTISAANSLVGSKPYEGERSPGDAVGSDGAGHHGPDPHGGVISLSNGDYVVRSPAWSGGGAVTWGNGSSGVHGAVSDTNSLVGTGIFTSVVALRNGSYVVLSPSWNGSRGAVTWGNGSTGISGTISDANSLVGSNPGDSGDRNFGGFNVTILSNGNYVVRDPAWNGDRGAVTWGNSIMGVSGAISAANSLVGSNPNDGVGSYSVTPLSNGNYVVDSVLWNGNRGAVTWGNGSTGTSGTVSDANSLIGSNPNDEVGLGSVVPLSNGNYVVASRFWSDHRGAATWVSGTSGQPLDGLDTITPQNSLVGNNAYAALPYVNVVENSVEATFLAAFGDGRVTAGFTDPSKLMYATAQSQSVAIMPAFLTRTLNAGTAVVLQASNDITVNSSIIVSGGGHGGALTLQAGRSIVLNAPLTTDNGALNLIANDQVANGVVDAQRDPGSAVISMAPGAFLNTGSGTLTVELRNGAGLSNPESGGITMQTVTAGSVSVVNNGPSAGSDINLGPVTTSGSQSYASPNGTTTVAGNLATTDNAITFNDAVVVSDGVTVTAGASTVNFADSGTQTLQSGIGTTFGNLTHTGSGTLRLTSGLTVTGTFTNSAGTFAASDQPVTVAGSATIAEGTYLAGTAPQTFNGGLAITNGVFNSSTGPMNVTGGITLSGGLLSGVGTVDAVTAVGGTLAPGSDSPGVLTVGGAVAFNPATTLSIVLNGTDVGTGYSQLAVGGTIDLGSSSLSLAFGFEPPVGSSFEILTKTGTTPINGTFNGLAEGAIFSQGGYQFQIAYQGGPGGNSVVLTRLV